MLQPSNLAKKNRNRNPSSTSTHFLAARPNFRETLHVLLAANRQRAVVTKLPISHGHKCFLQRVEIHKMRQTELIPTLLLLPPPQTLTPEIWYNKCYNTMYTSKHTKKAAAASKAQQLWSPEITSKRLSKTHFQHKTHLYPNHSQSLEKTKTPQHKHTYHFFLLRLLLFSTTAHRRRQENILHKKPPKRQDKTKHKTKKEKKTRKLYKSIHKHVPLPPISSIPLHNHSKSIERQRTIKP